MENNIHSDELQHHGTKGMRWGIRRYQNPDGTLTPAGKKRYNKEVAKLKAEEAKIKAAEKTAANKAKTQAKFDKLDAKKQELERRKKALKGKPDEDDEARKKREDETPEETKARLMKSSDPKEILRDKDVLSNFELQERVNRINLEAQLMSKIPSEPKQKTALDYVDATSNAINKVTNLYRNVDTAYSTVTKSSIGKSIMKQLGIEEPRKKVDIEKFYKNIDTATDEEVAKMDKRIKGIDNISKYVNGISGKAKTDTQNIDYINEDKIQSMIDDAISNIMDEMNNKG